MSTGEARRRAVERAAERGVEQRDRARRAHPSQRWRAPQARLAARMRQVFAAEGFAHPDAAALAVWARGCRGLSVAAWAEVAGLAEAFVADAEAGRVPLTSLPAVLRPDLEGGTV